MERLAKMISSILAYRNRWPPWAVDPFLGCLLLNALVLFGRQQLVTGTAQGAKKSSSTKDKGSQDRAAEFKAFQWQWLSVYLVIMLADWLQGTHMYTLYNSAYGLNPGTLFAIGFTSSAIFGTFLGLYVDQYGRRLGCITFCLLEIVINILEHYNNWYLLAVGRVMGGISTSLLFTAFESWMVSEHRRRGFPEEDIAKTFALAQMGNGICAVLAGVLAQFSADIRGDIGPFQLAILLTVVALVMIWATWRENYGGGEDGDNSELLFKDAVQVIVKNPNIFLLGLVQSFFEGAMYTFVILWVPTLASMVPGGKPDEKDFAVFGQGQGWIFAAMMLCISLGGQVFEAMMTVTSVEKGTAMICIIASASMIVPIMSDSFFIVLASFLVVETCVGASFGALATVRSHLLPDQLQASIMNIFRVPLNILVVTGTTAGDHLQHHMTFALVVHWFIIAAGMQAYLSANISFQQSEESGKGSKPKQDMTKTQTDQSSQGKNSSKDKKSPSAIRGKSPGRRKSKSE